MISNGFLTFEDESTDDDFLFKSIDASRKFKLLFQKNRNIFRFFFAKKTSRQINFNKKFNNFFKWAQVKSTVFTKKTIYHVLYCFNFLYSQRHAMILFQNEYVFINSVVCVDMHEIVNEGDVIQIQLSVALFSLCDDFELIVGDKLELARQLIYRWYRHIDNVYKQAPSYLPRWVKYLYQECASFEEFAEIDYTVNTIFLLKQPKNLYIYSWAYSQFINVFLVRLYSWRYII
jgi:hypothetical protein